MAKGDWPVAVAWEKTFTRDEAKTFHDIFASQNIVSLLRDTVTSLFGAS